jgi:aryl-alcohol dehydrogenase-like predicted oxidoreductase
MQYRRLGRSGLQVSELSLGSWVTYHKQVDTRAATEMLAAAYDAGVNFFDNAEVYALGQSEVVMGEAFKALKWPRLNYIVSTKFFWGLERDGNTVNRKDTLNRKYLMQAIDGSLKRLQLDFVDLVYCHRPDPHTRQGAVLGHQRMVGQRYPCRLGDRRAPSLAQTGDGAAAVQPVPSQQGGAGIRPSV